MKKEELLTPKGLVSVGADIGTMMFVTNLASICMPRHYGIIRKLAYNLGAFCLAGYFGSEAFKQAGNIFDSVETYLKNYNASNVEETDSEKEVESNE